jgi:hypothetical protein
MQQNIKILYPIILYLILGCDNSQEIPNKTKSSSEVKSSIIQTDTIKTIDSMVNDTVLKKKDVYNESTKLLKSYYKSISPHDSLKFTKYKKTFTLGSESISNYSEPFTFSGKIVNFQQINWRMGPELYYTLKNNRGDSIEINCKLKGRINGVDLEKINSIDFKDQTKVTETLNKIRSKKLKITFIREEIFGETIIGYSRDELVTLEVLK